jgi:hypothetical protein
VAVTVDVADGVVVGTRVGVDVAVLVAVGAWVGVTIAAWQIGLLWPRASFPRSGCFWSQTLLLAGGPVGSAAANEGRAKSVNAMETK